MWGPGGWGGVLKLCCPKMFGQLNDFWASRVPKINFLCANIVHLPKNQGGCSRGAASPTPMNLKESIRMLPLISKGCEIKIYTYTKMWTISFALIGCACRSLCYLLMG